MHPDIVQELLALNSRFYQSFAAEFSATRGRLQPGVEQLRGEINPEWQVLDIGCGNGAFGRALIQGGHTGDYLGIDASEGLIAAARAGKGRYEVRDLSREDWHRGLAPIWDLVTAFAVLHHFPEPEQQRIVAQVWERLAPGGQFMLSNWQFLNSPRLVARIQPWSRAGIESSAVSSADYLLDWRRGGEGLRYVYHFSDARLAELAAQTGFNQHRSFASDGKEGNLAQYQIWRKPNGPTC
jgi:2-polyprenyl-3-methyl-5-hydroxy-6-metoxy-1,4-benzoquinol methylase